MPVRDKKLIIKDWENNLEDNESPNCRMRIFYRDKEKDRKAIKQHIKATKLLLEYYVV